MPIQAAMILWIFVLGRSLPRAHLKKLLNKGKRKGALIVYQVTSNSDRQYLPMGIWLDWDAMTKISRIVKRSTESRESTSRGKKCWLHFDAIIYFFYILNDLLSELTVQQEILRRCWQWWQEDSLVLSFPSIVFTIRTWHIVHIICFYFDARIFYIFLIQDRFFNLLAPKNETAWYST